MRFGPHFKGDFLALGLRADKEEANEKSNTSREADKDVIIIIIIIMSCCVKSISCINLLSVDLQLLYQSRTCEKIGISFLYHTHLGTQSLVHSSQGRSFLPVCSFWCRVCTAMQRQTKSGRVETQSWET